MRRLCTIVIFAATVAVLLLGAGCSKGKPAARAGGNSGAQATNEAIDHDTSSDQVSVTGDPKMRELVQQTWGTTEVTEISWNEAYRLLSEKGSPDGAIRDNIGDDADTDYFKVGTNEVVVNGWYEGGQRKCNRP